MANQISGLFQKLMQNPQVMRMANQMYNSMSGQGQGDFLQKAGFLTDDIRNTLASQAGSPVDFSKQNLAEALAENGQSLSAGNLGSLALGAAKAHPFKTAGLVGLGAGNIGGLTDNDKFGGQLGGLALGGLGAATLASGNPYLQAAMTMGGGELGALFDKLRARKELEEQQGIPNAGSSFATMQR